MMMLAGTLCKYYMSTGQCEFGSICQYAHGEFIEVICRTILF